MTVWMPDYRYIVLSCHATEVSEKGQALVLLLDFPLDHLSRERKWYLFSDFARTLDSVSSSAQKWIVATFVEMHNEELDPDFGTDEMFERYSSLNIGPLRTACAGTFNCGSLSQALMQITVEISLSSLTSIGTLLSFDNLRPLDATIRSLATRINPA